MDSFAGEPAPSEEDRERRRPILHMTHRRVRFGCDLVCGHTDYLVCGYTDTTHAILPKCLTSYRMHRINGDCPRNAFKIERRMSAAAHEEQD